MFGINPLHLCAWHLIRWSIYRTFQQSKTKEAFELSWVPEVIIAIHRRMKLPFQLISLMLLYICLTTITSLSFVFFGIVCWFILFFSISTTSQLDAIICCCSIVLYWLGAPNWNHDSESRINSVGFLFLSLSSTMLCGIILMDLSMDLFGFICTTSVDCLVRVSRYYTLIFQVRVNYIAYLLLILQPVCGVYCYFFIGSPFRVLSFGIVLVFCIMLAVIWNVLVVKILHYSKVQMLIPGTQQKIPCSFDYVMVYRFLTIIHLVMFIALITNVITI